jgi:hypothetical protein
MPFLAIGLRRLTVLSVVLTVTAATPTALTQDPESGGALVPYDGGGQEVLQSIFVPLVANAPFSLTLQTEWSRPMPNGGSFTTTNTRPIKRDHAGRTYQERWFLTPKGSKIPSRMSWIQIADPVAHTYYLCNPRQKVCELSTLNFPTTLRFDPNGTKSGPLPNNRGTRTHEDLGATSFAGLPVHEYKDTTTINPGELGNDLPMSSVRQYRFSEQLGINLTSVVEAPQIGRQSFIVTDININEPDPSFFQPPQAYTVRDHRAGTSRTSQP